MNQTIIIIIVIVVCVCISISIGGGIFIPFKPKPTNAPTTPKNTTTTPNPNSYYIDENNITRYILLSSLPLDIKNAKKVYIYNPNGYIKLDGIYTFQGKSQNISSSSYVITIHDGLFSGTISKI